MYTIYGVDCNCTGTLVCQINPPCSSSKLQLIYMHSMVRTVFERGKHYYLAIWSRNAVEIISQAWCNPQHRYIDYASIRILYIESHMCICVYVLRFRKSSSRVQKWATSSNRFTLMSTRICAWILNTMKWEISWKKYEKSNGTLLIDVKLSCVHSIW